MTTPPGIPAIAGSTAVPSRPRWRDVLDGDTSRPGDRQPTAVGRDGEAVPRARPASLLHGHQFDPGRGVPDPELVHRDGHDPASVGREGHIVAKLDPIDRPPEAGPVAFECPEPAPDDRLAGEVVQPHLPLLRHTTGVDRTETARRSPEPPRPRSSQSRPSPVAASQIAIASMLRPTTRRLSGVNAMSLTQPRCWPCPWACRFNSARRAGGSRARSYNRTRLSWPWPPGPGIEPAAASVRPSGAHFRRIVPGRPRIIPCCREFGRECSPSAACGRASRPADDPLSWLVPGRSTRVRAAYQEISPSWPQSPLISASVRPITAGG